MYSLHGYLLQFWGGRGEGRHATWTVLPTFRASLFLHIQDMVTIPRSLLITTHDTRLEDVMPQAATYIQKRFLGRGGGGRRHADGWDRFSELYTERCCYGCMQIIALQWLYCTFRYRDSSAARSEFTKPAIYFSSCAQTDAIILFWICNLTPKYRQSHEIVASVWRCRWQGLQKRRPCTAYLHGITVTNKVNIGASYVDWKAIFLRCAALAVSKFYG